MASSFRTRYVVAVALGAALLVPVFASGTASAKAKHKTFVVCKHGCDYRTIQSAVDKSRKGDTVRVKPGKYVEGVLVKGSKRDGLRIVGTGKKPGAVVLEGKNAKTPDGSLANNGIEGDGVDRLVIKNLKVSHYVANGVFLHGHSDTAKAACHGYLLKNLVAAYARAYGLFAFNCTGGRMTRSVAYGSGDSGYYVGATPSQKKPQWTSLDHLKGYRNNQAFSGTNARYVNIHDSDFFNNGIGLTPNTLDSEPYEPGGHSVIQDNNIFWNNFNYYLPNSPVQTTSGGLGTIGNITINFPTGIGVVLFGVNGWTVKNNNIFGNFKWGVGAFSDPVGNTGDDAISRNNRIINNKMGRNGTDTNAVDFFVDGSGSGNCFEGNTSSTFDPSPTATNANLYPTCPAPDPPASGTDGSTGDVTQQFGDLVGYVLSDPPQTQQCSWIEHPHPAFRGYQPLEVKPGPTCGP